MKKLLLCVLSIFMLTACSSSASQTTEVTPSPSTTSTASTNVMEGYEKLEEDNVFYTKDQDSVMKLIEHGTGVVYIGFKECPWCQAYAPYLDEVSKEYGLSVLYYDILNDRKENTEFYQNLVETIGEQGDDITGYDNDGNARIYVPLVLYVANGEIIGYDGESNQLSTDDISVEDYWTEERVSALKEKLGSYSEIVKKAQDENNSQGCDVNSCADEN